jgi:hypothetical protein
VIGTPVHFGGMTDRAIILKFIFSNTKISVT